MPVINPFATDAFDMVALTAAINKIPNTYGRLEQLGLMLPQGVRTRTIIIEEMSGVLNLLPTQPVGAPGTLGTTGKRKVRSFVIPHIPHDDTVLPEEVQGIRAFGSETELDALANLLAMKLQNMRNKHAITLEHLRMGALKGVILDADGSTLYNLYTEFGITPKTVNFDLTTATTEVLLKVLEVKRHIEDNLKGEFMTGILCLCSSGFFDALTTHAKVKEAYARWQEGRVLFTDNRIGFTFGGVTFEEYRGQATDAAGNVRKFVADDEAHFFPLGTANTFRTYFAPADFNETANTLGLPLYAKQEPRKFGRGTDLHTQQNPLPICLRPGSPGQRHQVLTMSDWASLVSAQDDACLRAFGRDVTYTSQAGVSSVVRGILDKSVEAEESDRGVYAGLFTKTSAFSSPPVRGEEVTVDNSIYKIVDINADGEGGLRMILRFHREVG